MTIAEQTRQIMLSKELSDAEKLDSLYGLGASESGLSRFLVTKQLCS
jgi:hypothetical protein